MAGRGNNDHETYPECKHMPKSVPKEITEAQALALPISKGENVLPLFERKISDYKRIKQCSLETNDTFKCRWNSYVKNIEGMKRTPFQFPNISNLHFYNGGIKFIPSLSPTNRTTYRRQMGLGPGVDQHGPIPIPYDLGRPKSTAKTNTKKVQSSKVKRH